MASDQMESQSFRDKHLAKAEIADLHMTSWLQVKLPLILKVSLKKDLSLVAVKMSGFSLILWNIGKWNFKEAFLGVAI